ncbi:hypothetical protein DBR42_01740 [Pelomonas sp. HMWF004]|nr:hypothetical protein DBR42_01740 [Pelomonas sp. HMWF004]
MLRRHLIALSLYGPAASQAQAEHMLQADDPASRLAWVAGDLPPFAWMSPEGPRGYAHELALLMAQRLGRAQEVAYYPWARAVRLVEHSDRLGVFPLARTPDREARFQWLVPLMTVRYVFLTLVGGAPLGLAELRRMRVGVLRGSPILLNLRKEQFSRVVDGKDYQELLRMLTRRTLQAVYAGAPMLDAAIETYGYDRQQFSIQQPLGEAELYMATSPKLAPAEAERWQQAYRQFDEDGSVKRLRQRYFGR